MKYNKLHEKLDSYRLLEDNWDGCGGIKPSEQLIEAVRKFLLVLENEAIKAPRLMLSGSNEIGLFWKKENYYFEINFDDENDFSYFYKIDGKIFGEDEMPTSCISKHIKDILRLY